MKPVQIDLDIETLVLHNLPNAQRGQIALALEEELTRLLSEYGLPPRYKQGGNIPHLDIGSIEVGSKPAIVGTQLALRIYRALGGNERNTSQCPPIPMDHAY